MRAELSRPAAWVAAAAVATIAFGCGSAEGARNKAAVGKVQHGNASYYGRGFVGRKTASGERFDPNAMTAAHKTLPFGTRVRVTRTNGNGASVTVRVNDRCGCPHGRIIDLSEGAARKLDMIRVGVVPVRLEVIK